MAKKNETFEDVVGSKVDSLTKIYWNNEGDSSEIVRFLQQINEELLNHKIKISYKGKEIFIYPLWVEAYYRNDNMKFVDKSCHRSDKGDCEQYKFRLHKKINSESKNRGVDIYLGKGKDYYLSFLIKIAYIEKEHKFKICSQTEIIDFLPKKDSFYEGDLEFTKTDLDYSNCRFVNAARHNLTTDDNNDFNDLSLATFIEDKNFYRAYPTLRKKYKIEKNTIDFNE